MRVGVVGFSGKKFDEEKARQIIGNVLMFYPPGTIVVSGLTNLGIPAISYQVAVDLGFQTMGIACKKAGDYECFPCDRTHIIGEKWGDESEAFLGAIDVLIRVGGGAQAIAETARAKELGIEVHEFDLAEVVVHG